MERPKRKEDLIDKSSAFIRSRTKETIVFGAAGIGISILGEKINNDLLSESGTASAALAYMLITFS